MVILKLFGTGFFFFRELGQCGMDSLGFHGSAVGLQAVKNAAWEYFSRSYVCRFLCSGWVIILHNFASCRQGGTLVLALLAAMVFWETAFKEKESGPGLLTLSEILIVHLALLVRPINRNRSLFSALGFEGNLEKLKRNYYYDWILSQPHTAKSK